MGRDHDVQQELQSEEEGRWAPRGGGEDEYDDDDDDDDGGRLILMAPVVGGVTSAPSIGTGVGSPEVAVKAMTGGAHGFHATSL